ncbi:MAG: type II toxin-antitoxin system VapC family toxin [bacterium]
MNLVDSSGWLEYFSAGANADFFTPAIEDTKNLIVSTINLYEVFKKVLIEKDEDSALQVIAVMQQAEVKDIDSRISLFAAKLSYEHKLPMADSLILATTKSNKATLWTQDSDFKTFSEVQYIEKV